MDHFHVLVGEHDTHHYIADISPSVAAGSRGTQMRTHRAEVHETGKGNDPGVLEIDNVAAIELGEELALDARESERRELTKRPSASQLLKVNMTPGVTLRALGAIDSWYPNGPGGIVSSTPEKSRLSI